MATRLTTKGRARLALLSIVVGCRYGGPLAGGRSEIREGTLPDLPARFLQDAGAARSMDDLLPAAAVDSAAIYLLAIDQRAFGLANVKVAVLARGDSTAKFPRSGWENVDAHGVYVRRFSPGEYVVFVQDPFHWAARRVIRLRVNAVDTLLAIMRSGVVPGGRDVMGFPPNDGSDPQNR